MGMKKYYIIESLIRFVAVIVALFVGTIAAAQTVLYVDDDAFGIGDGLSWSSAFTDLQDALDLARANSQVAEIWVAGGTYYPDRDTGDRDATFALVSNVGVYGGFQGNESTRPPRDSRISETVLSGDIGITDDSSDNSKAVVSVFRDVDSAQIENMTVIRGNGGWGSGINIHFLARTPSVEGCMFRENLSTWGGAILIEEAEGAIIVDCDFYSNTANHGGAIYLANIESTTEIVNCRFYNNHAFGFGGAIDNVSSHPNIRNCTFYGNTADREGGALGNNGADAVLFNCILWGNSPNEIRLFVSTVTATYSVITGGWDGVGNLDIDPNFVDESVGDLRLQPNSPCIDAGDNDALLAEQTLDLDFNPRVVDDLGTADTGNGTAPLVDMGSYEFQGVSFALLDPQPGEAGRINRLRAIGAMPGERIWFVYGLLDGSTSVPGCAGLVVDIDTPKIVGRAIANGAGIATIDKFVLNSARGREILFQGVSVEGCAVTRLRRTVFN